MSKYITIKDNKTSESLFPTTHTDLILDDNGNSILGFVDNKIKELDFTIAKKTNKIIHSENSIINLDGKNPTREEKIISKNVTQIAINKNTLTNLELNLNTEQNRLDNSITKDNCYTENDVIEVLDYLNKTTGFIEFGTPTTKPNRKRIMVDNNNLYIGIYDHWYVIKLKTYE